MNASISNEDKKIFLKWFINNFELKRREALWILDYLYSHDIMLEKTHFVENVEKTPRGIYMSVKGNQQPSFRFYKNGHTFKDAMQAFHEIRLNWSSQLYIELGFSNAWHSPEYLNILEDNPHARWNDTIPQEVITTTNNALDYITLLFAREKVLSAIDDILVEGESDNFNYLAEKLREINIKIDEKIANSES